MNDLERRLRAAMSAAGGPPPAGLMAGIRRRHRRHLLRAGAGCIAVVAALALAAPPATHALRSALHGLHAAGTAAPAGRPCPSVPAPADCSRQTGPSAPASGPPQVCPVFCGPPTSSPRAAPGTVLRGCQSNNGGGTEIAGYRARSVRAGPVWFVWGKQQGYWPVSKELGDGQVSAVGVPMAVQAGARAVVRVAPGARARFRFLATFSTADRYRLSQGRGGITFAACPASYLGPVTVFWIGYLNGGLSCVPFQVSVAGERPVQVSLSVSGGVCGRRA